MAHIQLYDFRLLHTIWVNYLVFTQELFRTSKAISETRGEWEGEHLNNSTLLIPVTEVPQSLLQAGNGGGVCIFTYQRKSSLPPQQLWMKYVGICESRRGRGNRKKRRNRRRAQTEPKKILHENVFVDYVFHALIKNFLSSQNTFFFTLLNVTVYNWSQSMASEAYQCTIE